MPIDSTTIGAAQELGVSPITCGDVSMRVVHVWPGYE
jgi:hypothetical protein